MITVEEMMNNLNLQLLGGSKGLKQDVQTGYCGELLSFVMAHAKEKAVWITVQGHMNTLAVAMMINASAIILAENVKVEDAICKKADEEGIPLFTSSLSSFELATRIGAYL